MYYRQPSQHISINEQERHGETVHQCPLARERTLLKATRRSRVGAKEGGKYPIIRSTSLTEVGLNHQRMSSEQHLTIRPLYMSLPRKRIGNYYRWWGWLKSYMELPMKIWLLMKM